jgi:hypothetical protein
MQRLFLNAWDLSSIENYVRVIVFAPDLRRASFYDKTGLLFHSTTIKLVPRPKLIMTPTRSSKSHSNARSLYHPCGCRGADLYAMSQCLSVPPIKEADGRNNSAHPQNYYSVFYFSALSRSKLVAGETVAVRSLDQRMQSCRENTGLS